MAVMNMNELRVAVHVSTDDLHGRRAMQYKQRVFEKNTEAAWVAAFTCLCIYVHVETSTVCGHIGIYNYGP